MAESKIETVRALLAKAANPAVTDAERDAFTAGAMKLMAKYSITQAMLDAASGKEEGATLKERTISFSGSYTYERMLLLNSLAQVFSCAGCYQQRGRVVVGYTIVGHGDDIEQVALLWSSLSLQVTNGVIRARLPEQRIFRMSGGEEVSLTTFRRNWIFGFRAAVIERLLLARQDASADYEREHGGSTELVLASRRDRAQRAVDSLGYRRCDVRQRSGPGMYEGYDAGYEADLNERARLGGQQ